MNTFAQNIESLGQADRFFSLLGATHYHEEFYPPEQRYTCGGFEWVSKIFSRHYFNAEGTEIGYSIPDIMPECQPLIFETPRVWGIEHTLHELPAAFADGVIKCEECNHLFDDNPGKDTCKTCEDWRVDAKG